jgi:hypothetical protein
MIVDFIFAWQIGIMFSAGVNYEKRKYITIELPFLMVLLSSKRKNK